MEETNLMSQRVIFNGRPTTVKEVLDVYQREHPTWRAVDLGRVFIGEPESSRGFWLDKAGEGE
jgi:hypothetical protein